MLRKSSSSEKENIVNTYYIFEISWPNFTSISAIGLFILLRFFHNCSMWSDFFVSLSDILITVYFVTEK